MKQMDFHLVSEPEPKQKQTKLSFRSLFSRFLPLFMLAMILPFFLMITISPEPTRLTFLTRADRAPELRIWFEPSTIIVSAGQTAKLQVVALFESDKKFLPGLEVEINNQTLSYKKPFKGQVVLGEISVPTNTAGKLSIPIVQDKIRLTAFTDTVTFVTSPATILVR